VERILIASILAVALVGGCATAPLTPAAVRPTLNAMSTLGLGCSDTTVDNVPSGLLQWSCRGTVRDASLTVVVDGDAAGIFEIVAQVPGATDPATASRVFADLVAAMPPLAPSGNEIRAWVQRWDGRSQSLEAGAAHLQMQQDGTWITLAIVAGSPAGFPPGDR
jgi:hypothetical protein